MSAGGGDGGKQTPKKSTAPTGVQIVKSLIAGGVAGGLSRTAVAPLERLKILMQVQGNEKIYKGVAQGLMHMAKTEGMRGMMKGNWTNCVRIIPNSAMKFFTFEQLCRLISDHQLETTGSGALTPGLRLAAGAGAGIVAMSATYPLDMVRGRLTVQEGRNVQYTGIVHATKTIMREEGFLAFYRGWLPSVIGVVPYVGLNFGVYETLKATMLAQYGLRDERELSVGARLGCGAMAGMTGQTVAYPFDVARRRLQVSGWQGARELHSDHGSVVAYRGMTDCFVRTVREEGFGALFKGLWPNYLKVVPSIAIAFVTYEQVKEMLGVEIRISE
ncbi:MAG: mitochondrial substrate carrier [Monoraphidium minutum]|nr:MAG: mitochondrial substrate carrier [Monoraphidium minutum]